MDKEKEVKKKTKIRDICILQAVIAVYTLSTVFAKFASGQEFLSFKFILFYGIEILILGVYAIIWQQLIKKFDIVALQEVLSEGKILYGPQMKSPIGEAKAYERSLMRRLGNNWRACWCDPKVDPVDISMLDDDEEGDRRGEGYVFLWRTDKFELLKNPDGTEILPEIYTNYDISNGNKRKLIRNPAYGRFKIIGRPCEIRLITTHIIFGKKGMFDLRQDEFDILAGQIYSSINEYKKDIKCNSSYTILLGDYNLNLQEIGRSISCTVPPVVVFDRQGERIYSCVTMNDYSKMSNYNSDNDNGIIVYTVQTKKSTIKNKEPGFANNYDHFSFDSRVKNISKGANVIDGVKLLYGKCTSEEERFSRFRKEISDHLPIIIYIDC